MSPAGPNEAGIDGFILGWMVALGTLLLALLKRSDPRLLLVWLNEPLMRPVHHKLDKICRVIDKMPGSEAAHEAVNAEDARNKKRWDG